MCLLKVDMRWSSKQKKNYLHLAAERGLPKVLRLLLERARFQNISSLLIKYIILSKDKVMTSLFIEHILSTMTHCHIQGL